MFILNWLTSRNLAEITLTRNSGLSIMEFVEGERGLKMQIDPTDKEVSFHRIS